MANLAAACAEQSSNPWAGALIAVASLAAVVAVIWIGKR